MGKKKNPCERDFVIPGHPVRWKFAKVWAKFAKNEQIANSQFCSCSDIPSEEYKKIQKAQQCVRNCSIQYLREENKGSTKPIELASQWKNSNFGSHKTLITLF